MIEIGDLPRRGNAKTELNFRKVILQSNSFLIDISKINSLYIYAVKVVKIKGQSIISDSERDKIIANQSHRIKKIIHQPIIKNGLIFSRKTSAEKDHSIVLDNYIIIIREICKFDVLKSPKTLVYFFSNVLRKIMEKLGYIEISRTNKFINMENKVEIENLLVYSGFRLSFELFQNSFYLNVDTTMKVVRNESVLQFINNIYKRNDCVERDQKREILKKSLVNQIIMTNYGKVRYVRIEDILFTDLTQIVVQSYQMLLTEYYKKKYDYNIKNLKQPIICATSNNRKTKLFLIPELCLMTGVPQSIDQSKNKQLTQLPRFSAEKRKKLTQSFIKTMVDKEGEQIFTTLGIKIEEKLAKIQAKIMPAPRIVFGKGKCVQSGKQTGFSCQDYEVFRQKSNTKLAVISLDGIDCSTLVTYIYDSCKNINLKIEIITVKVDSCNLKYKPQGLFKLIQQVKQKQKSNICLIILPDRMFPQYQKIKQYCIIEKEFVSQIALERTLKKKNFQSINSKIMIQILAKAGNAIWASVPKIKKEKVMFVAYYSTEIGKLKTNSFTLGICSTCQQTNTQIFSKTKRFDKEHQEIQLMKQLFLEALNEYKKKNQSIPDDIIILQNQKPSRDPILTNKFFVQPINTTLKQYYGDKKPKLTYLLISKQGHHRFYQTKNNSTTNPPVGAIIQGKKDQKAFSNFYMVTHGVSKNGGSVIPLNYKTIFTNSEIPQFVLQSFLFSQCFNYLNYSGAIKQPGLLQNAIKCTKFRAQALNNREISDSMKMCPYYL